MAGRGKKGGGEKIEIGIEERVKGRKREEGGEKRYKWRTEAGEKVRKGDEGNR